MRANVLQGAGRQAGRPVPQTTKQLFAAPWDRPPGLSRFFSAPSELFQRHVFLISATNRIESEINRTSTWLGCRGSPSPVFQVKQVRDLSENGTIFARFIPSSKCFFPPLSGRPVRLRNPRAARVADSKRIRTLGVVITIVYPATRMRANTLENISRRIAVEARTVRPWGVYVAVDLANVPLVRLVSKLLKLTQFQMV